MNLATSNSKDYYNAVAPHYDDLYLDPLSLAENQIVGDLLMQRIRTLGTSVRILDLGCGTGLAYDLIAPVALKEGIKLDYHGIDISEKMIYFADVKHYNNVDCRFEVKDMNHLSSIKTESVDFVCSIFGSFSHAENYEHVIREIKRVLKPGGKLFLITYSPYSLRNIWTAIRKRSLNSVKFNQPYDVRNNDATISCPAYFYSKQKMSLLLEKNGFDQCHFQGLNLIGEVPFLKTFLRNSNAIGKVLRLELKLSPFTANFGHSLITEAVSK